MRLKAAYVQVMTGIDARIKLVEIILALRTLGYPTTGDVVADVKSALADRFTEYDRGYRDGQNDVTDP